MTKKDYDLIAINLGYRMHVADKRYSKRNDAVLELENFASQLKSAFQVENSEFNPFNFEAVILRNRLKG